MVDEIRAFEGLGGDSPWRKNKILADFVEAEIEEIDARIVQGIDVFEKTLRLKLFVEQHDIVINKIQVTQETVVFEGKTQADTMERNVVDLRLDVRRSKARVTILEAKLEKAEEKKIKQEEKDKETRIHAIALEIAEKNISHENSLQFSKYILIGQGAAVLTLLNLPVGPETFIASQQILIAGLWILTIGILSHLLSEIIKRSKIDIGWVNVSEKVLYVAGVLSLVFALVFFLIPNTNFSVLFTPYSIEVGEKDG